jgi:Raf kinase inhibitor-like YbhB/YbcL family protein
MGNLALKSSAFNHMGEIPSKYTCQGENISPPLEISGVPQNTKSLVLLMEDIDPPIGRVITHWVICHLSSHTNIIPEGSDLADAVVGKNMRGKNKYMGPCPPKGKHRYLFKLFALDAKLALDSKCKKKKVLNAIEGHVIEETKLTGSYIRQK